MHDPMVVAFDIPRLWPQISRTTPRSERRIEVRYSRRKWWDIRPATFRKFWRFGSVELYWPAAVTIWHVEPNGHDALTVCKHTSRWKWHAHHWHVQVALEQRLRRFLFERCIECGQRYPWGYAPVSHQWDAPKSHWFRIERHAYHHQCSNLDGLRRSQEHDADLIRALVAEVRVRADEDEEQTVERLTGVKSRAFRHARRLMQVTGYDRDDDYNLVKAEATS